MLQPAEHDLRLTNVCYYIERRMQNACQISKTKFFAKTLSHYLFSQNNLSLTMLWIHLWISLVISRFQTEQFALIDTEYFDQNCPYTECLCVPYLSQNRFIVLTNSYTPHLTRYSWRDWVPIIWRISSQVFSSPGLQSAKLVPNKSQT